MSRSWAVLASAIVVNVVVAGLSFGYLRLFVSELMSDLGLTLGQWGILGAGTSFGTLVSQIPGGVLGDRFGVRRVVTAGLVLKGMALLLLSTAGGFSSMLFSMVLSGIGGGVIGPNLPKALGAWFRSERLGLVNGLTGAGLGMGNVALGLWSVSVAAYLGGWRALTAVLGSLVIALALFWPLAVRDAPSSVSKRPANRSVLAPMLQVLQLKSVWILALCNLLFVGALLGALAYIFYYLENVRGVSPETPGRMFALASGSFTVGCTLLPALSDRIGLRKPVYIIAMLVAAAAMLGQTFLVGASFVAANVIWGFSGSAAVLLFVVPVEMKRIGPGLAGTACGVIGSAGALGGVLLQPIGMKLAEARPVMGFVFFASCLVLSALLFGAIRETGPRRRAEPEA